MTIARGQMNRQLYQDGSRGIRDLMEGKISDDEIRNIISVLEDVDIIDEDVMSDEDMEVMENLRLKQMAPEYQYDENNPYSGREGNMRAQGGIMSVNRENFGIGSKLKKAFRKIIPNELADIAVKAAPVVGFFNPALGAGMQAFGTFDRTGSISDSLKRAGLQYLATQGGRKLAGGDFQGNPFESGEFFKLTTPKGTNVFDVFKQDGSSAFSKINPMSDIDDLYTTGKEFDVIKQNDPKSFFSLKKVTDYLGGKIADIDLADIAKVAIMGKSYFDSRADQERFNKLAEEAYKKYTAARDVKRKQYLGDGELTGIEVLNPTRTTADVVKAARGGIINSRKGYMMGSEVPIRENQAGVSEMDFRETGGFVPPVGIKEKADDITAMLSNNEFVFTADAVRAAGGGSVNKGAQKMYALMKQLEGQA